MEDFSTDCSAGASDAAATFPIAKESLLFDEPAENKLLKLLKEGAMREAREDEAENRETDNRLLRILRDKKKRSDFEPSRKGETAADAEPPKSAPESGAPPPRKEAATRRKAEAPPPEPPKPEPIPEAVATSDDVPAAVVAEPPPRPAARGEGRDARAILAAARTDEPAPSQASPAQALREMLKAATEAPAPTPMKPVPPREPVARPVPTPEPAARPQPAKPPTAPVAPPPAEPPPAIAENPAPPTPRPRPAPSPARPLAEPWPAPEGGLALTLLLKGEQIDFLVKMAEGGQPGSLMKLLVVAQCLMGGQGEWGLAGLLQEYARAITGVLNKLMIQERMKKAVDLGTVKDADLDGLLEEIRDLLETEALSATLDPGASSSPGLLLGVRLPKEDVAFLRKLASPRGELTLVSHLLFTQALMAHEIVPSSPWPEGAAAARIRQDFKTAVQNYRELQKGLLNQILVNARLGKKTAWGGPGAVRHEAALAELAKTLKACLPGAHG